MAVGYEMRLIGKGRDQFQNRRPVDIGALAEVKIVKIRLKRFWHQEYVFHIFNRIRLFQHISYIATCEVIHQSFRLGHVESLARQHVQKKQLS